MKIIHLIHGLNTGGAETLVKDYALNMNSSDCQVMVLCYEHRDSPYETILKDAGVKVCYAEDDERKVGRMKMLSRAQHLAHLIAFTRKTLKEEKPDVLHTHLSINFIVLMSHPAKGIKLFHTVHSNPDAFWKTKSRNLRTWLGKRLDFWSAKRLCRRHGMSFITLYQQMCDEVNKLFGVRNTLVLNNAIDFSRFDDLKDRAVVRDSLAIPRDAFVVGNVGRFARVKNHRFLIRVFEEVRRLRQDAFLLLVGSGELKEQIVGQLKEKDLYEHALILSNRPDVPDLLNTMDVYVVTSLYEGVPVSVIEAQKAGLPCIISTGVPDKATISNLVSKLDLDAGAEAWAKAVAFSKKTDPVIYNDIDKWSMAHAVSELRRIYEGSPIER